MLRRIGGIAALVAVAVMLSASVARAAAADERKDFQVFKAVADSVNRYDRITIFDSVDIGVKNGVVTLTGKVTNDLKRDEIGKQVAKVDGVRKLNNNIAVLPLSPFDDQLRARLAKVIYGNTNFTSNRGAVPSIRIIVENGHVTLTGVVNNDFDRQLAQTLVKEQSGVFSVKNELKTDAEMKAALEKL
jgi:hyperosmotically inducible periplasmic protein